MHTFVFVYIYALWINDNATKSINVEGEFFKIGKGDFTFINEMRVIVLFLTLFTYMCSIRLPGQI